MKPKRPAISSRSAFTLAELVIVLTILTVLASVVVPAVRSAGTQSIESVSRILATDLRLARSQAIQFNTNYTVRFDPTNNAYDLAHTGTGSPPPLEVPLSAATAQNGTYHVELGTLGAISGRDNGIRLAGAVLANSRQSTAEVTFGPLGGTGPLRNEDTLIWLTTGSGSDVRFVRLTVSWITGQVWLDRPQMFNTENQPSFAETAP